MFRNIKEAKIANTLKNTNDKKITIKVEDTIIDDWECSYSRRNKISKEDGNIYLHCYLPSSVKSNKIRYKFAIIFSNEVGELFDLKKGDRVFIKSSPSNPSLLLVEKVFSDNAVGSTKITGNSKSTSSLRIQFQRSENFSGFPQGKRCPLSFSIPHDSGFIIDTAKIIE